jgi:hypothetical protein
VDTGSKKYSPPSVTKFVIAKFLAGRAAERRLLCSRRFVAADHRLHPRVSRSRSSEASHQPSLARIEITAASAMRADVNRHAKRGLPFGVVGILSGLWRNLDDADRFESQIKQWVQGRNIVSTAIVAWPVLDFHLICRFHFWFTASNGVFLFGATKHREEPRGHLTAVPINMCLNFMTTTSLLVLHLFKQRSRFWGRTRSTSL